VLDLERPRGSPATWEFCDIRRPDLGGARLRSYDAVFLLAAFLAKRCDEDPVEGWRTNVAGLANVVEALRQAGGPVRLIYFSSAMVYAAESRACVAEDAPLAGAGLYGHSKLIGEHLLCAAADTLAWDATVLRPFTVYGPGPAAGERGHFIARWLELVRAGAPLPVHGSGMQTVDLVHVDDVTAACLAVLDRPAVPGRFRAYNVGSGAETTILQLADWFREVEPGVRTIVSPSRAPAVVRRFADLTRSEAELGWRPLTMPREGIPRLVREQVCRVARP
jgi:UDP-glucose 4-epimerase